MIVIIFAPPRTGKTCFMTHLANLVMFDRQRNRLMQNELITKQQHGFKNIKTIPQHCVSANYDIVGRKFGYSPRHNRRINPYRLGFANKYVKTHFTLPYELIAITEAQKYLNSRMAMYYPDWQSRWYEQHGHNHLDILLDTQRPMLIDPNIRELSIFIEIVKLDIKKDENGQIKGLKWQVRKIDNSGLFDRYMSSGKTDTGCYTESIVEADYNVFNSYDSTSCKPKFYEGHMGEDIDYNQAEPMDETIEGYIKYLEENDDEMPEKFFRSRSIKKEKEENVKLS